MNRQLVILALLAVSVHCFAQDAVDTDGDKYKVLVDNSCVRVLEYRDQPGQVTHQHNHPAFVLYALAPFKRDIQLSDGKMIHRTFKAGDVLWSPAQRHIGKNVGTTPTHAIIVESKPSGQLLPECSGKSPD
jgi:quercetin dioxygenase-like cupin family protein